MSTAATVITQYRDPITRERRTVALCDQHNSKMLWNLRQTGTGCGSTEAPSLFSCEACANGDGRG